MANEKKVSQPSEDAIAKMVSVKKVLGMSAYKMPENEEEGQVKKGKSGGSSGSRWFNTATFLTLSRLALIPLIIFFYISGTIFTKSEFFSQYGRLIAVILFVGAAITDFVDGWVARKFNQVTDFGKILDPIADKCLTLTGFLLIATDVFLVQNAFTNVAILPVWFVVLTLLIMIGRDYVVNAMRQISAAEGKVIAADWTGKVKSIVQYVAITCLMFFAYDMANENKVFGVGTGFEVFQYIFIFILSFAAALSVYSMIHYICEYRKGKK